MGWEKDGDGKKKTYVRKRWWAVICSVIVSERSFCESNTNLRFLRHWGRTP
jgi:hypothetical protein